VVRGSKACPVKAFQDWLIDASITSGPVFRPVPKGGVVSAKALSPHSVGLLVKRYAKLAGHGVRAGFATSVGTRASLLKVMDVSRHSAVDSLAVRAYGR